MSLLEALGREIPSERLLTDADVVASLSGDKAEWAHVGAAAVALRARTEGEVAHAVRVCADLGVPIVPRGAGTGLSGGANAVDGCVVLDLSRMNAIKEIDADNLVAVVEAGVVNDDLKAAVAEHGLWYPPDPSSYEICSIGGNIATNAGGLCCVKYGVTTDYVLGMTVVLADGTAVRLGGPRLKDTAGLSLTKLFVVGLATDFCVAWSAIDARKAGLEVTVIEDATRGIDAQGSLAKAWADMSAAGVKRIQTADIAA